MKPIAFLDACVLYPSMIRDFFVRLFTCGQLYQPRWSTDVHSEWSKNLLEKRPDVLKGAIQRIIQLMNKLPDTYVVRKLYKHDIETYSLPAPDDRHVLAASKACRASYLVTFNLKDFPKKECAKAGVVAIHPNEFVSMLANVSLGKVQQTIANQQQSLKKPPLFSYELCKRLSEQGLPVLKDLAFDLD